VRIAFLAPQLEPSLGGVERHACWLAREFASRGEQVTVFTARPPIHREAEPATLEIVPVEVAPGRSKRRDERFDAAVTSLLRERALEHGEWDVIQSFFATRVPSLLRAGGGTHAAFLRALSPHVTLPRRLWLRLSPDHRRRVDAQRKLFRSTAFPIIAVSERVREELCADCDVPPERVRVIRNGTDLVHFRPATASDRALFREHYGLGSQTFTLALVGSGFERKGVRFAIQMLASLRVSGVDAALLVAGRGRPQRYQRQAQRLGVSPRVHFLGSVSDVRRVYAAADVGVLPSLYDPFGNAALEAMACGLPVVVTARVGVAEVMRDGREGCVLDSPDEIPRATAFLRDLARDPTARARCGQHARAAAETLDLPSEADRILGLYRDVASQPRADPEGSTSSSTECSPGTPTRSGNP
jgi:UDP-glucose:(heptosyl)LPS alpha-1,3-glucosyltransferase